MINSKKSNILLTIIAIMTLITLIISSTFAYFAAKIKDNKDDSAVIIEVASLSTINYVNGNELKLLDAYPGAKSNVIKFSISADANADLGVGYTLYWSDIINDFQNNEELVYNLSGTTNGSGQLITNQEKRQIPKSDDDFVIGSGKINPGETHEYTLMVEFLENGNNQNADQGKAFNGKIFVKTIDEG